MYSFINLDRSVYHGDSCPVLLRLPYTIYIDQSAAQLIS